MGKLDTPLCHYRYDALDQLVGLAPALQANTQRFYAQDKLATEIRGQESHTIIQHADQLLAQQRRQSTTVNTRLLLADRHRSILHILDTQAHLLNYTPYGYRPVEHRTSSLLEFNGERRDPVTGHYLLGNGYRAFNPILKRFNSPDNMSPFAEGGLNPYAYCMGDPINHADPTGHFIGAMIAALSTKAIAVAGAGLSVTGGFLANAMGRSISPIWTRAAAASTLAAGGVLGAAFGRAGAPLVIREIAQVTVVAGLVVTARAAAPAVRGVVNTAVTNLRPIAETLAVSALQTAESVRVTVEQVMQPIVNRINSIRRGFDLPVQRPSPNPRRQV